jgi:nucleotide-binding universal stress UspA family protein
MRDDELPGSDDGGTIDVRSVLCPIDFSSPSVRALDYALAVARWYGARLNLLHVHTAASGPAWLAGLARLEQPVLLTPAGRLEIVRELRALLGAADGGDLTIELDVADGDPVDEILAAAAGVDLVVMGTHGRAGVDRFLLGSVTAQVLRHAPCPVLAVPLRSRYATRAIPGLFHEILAAVDFSHEAQPAIGYAVSLAVEADAHLTLLHVARADAGPWPEPFLLRRLESFVPPDARVYCHVDERVEVGEPSREILRVAAERGTALIVMGPHAGPIGLLLAGSTTERVVREAGCAVMAVRANPGR